MSSGKKERLKRFNVASIPIIHSISNRLELKEILSKYIPVYGNEAIPVVDTLLLILYNITLGRKPLYEMTQWVQRIDPRCCNLEIEKIDRFNDDRFGRALDHLYNADRASLMTEIALKMIKNVNLDISRIHNDSTTVKAYGKIPGKTRTGLELKKGHSKDHRPDLKQLLFTLTISADGAVPVHYKTYSGNRTDDTTHIETWDKISEIAGTHRFIYVADCKVCTKKQLAYIVDKDGRVITIMPDTWKEAQTFKNELRVNKKSKKRILRKKNPSHMDMYQYFSLFSGDYKSTKDGYTIYWYHSSEKAKTDFQKRKERLEKADQALLNIVPRLNKRNLTSKIKIENEVSKVLKKYRVENFYKICIKEERKEHKKQTRKGRPGPNTKYVTIVKILYSLTWEKDEKSLKQEKNVDGIFPLLSTDDSIAPKEALQFYKYQPKLEKRFTQFKSVHEAAPLLFKKIERVEAIMFLFFLSLMIQAIIERQIRTQMKSNGLKALAIYPESRDAAHPTTSKILDYFDHICSYQIVKGEKIINEFQDKLSETQKEILQLLDINLETYWGASPLN